MKKQIKKHTVNTANGEVEIIPVYCEITGKIMGWRTIYCNSKLNIFPAFISLEIVNKKGKQKVDLSKIYTF